MLALVGIPNNKTPIEIHESLERFHPRTVQTKVIKTTASKYYAMLLLFEDESSSTQFYDAAFGQEYNGIEMERIILREMGDMTVTFTGLSKDSTPQVLPLRFLPKEGETINAEQIFRKSLTPPETKKQASNTSDPSYNTCAICFEEITDAIITILCGHSFHWECLGNWNQNTCPLCRYYQHPPIIKFCQQCNQCEGLWVCLICGIRLCCGSQNNILGHDSHIYQHYQQTSHSLSMELETKFLFDARQPAFLHQMFYKELMGDSNQMYQQGKCKSKTDKLKEKISEYGQDVSEQMQRQRKFFQDAISKSIKQNRQKLTKKKNSIENLSNEVQAINMRIQQAKKHNEDLMSEGLTLEKEYDIVKKVQNKIQQKQKCLKVERQKEQKEIDYYDQLIHEKREELRDIRKNVKLKEKLQENLDGQQVGFQFILGMGDKKKKKK